MMVKTGLHVPTKPTWVKPTVTRVAAADIPPLCVAVANPLVYSTGQQYRHTFTLAPVPGYSIELLPEAESLRRPSGFERLRAEETTGLIRRKATDAMDRCDAELWLGVKPEGNDE